MTSILQCPKSLLLNPLAAGFRLHKVDPCYHQDDTLLDIVPDGGEEYEYPVVAAL